LEKYKPQSPSLSHRYKKNSHSKGYHSRTKLTRQKLWTARFWSSNKVTESSDITDKITWMIVWIDSKLKSVCISTTLAVPNYSAFSPSSLARDSNGHISCLLAGDSKGHLSFKDANSAPQVEVPAKFLRLEMKGSMADRPNGG